MTIAYHERTFTQRFGAMGDKAEAKFLEVNPQAHSLGLNRPAFGMGGMAAFMRHTPDFMLRDGFYEVMGFSSRGNDSLKLKFEKADARRMWALHAPVFLWLYDSGMNVYYCAPIQQWIDTCHMYGGKNFFTDNERPYWNLSRSDFPVEAVPC